MWETVVATAAEAVTGTGPPWLEPLLAGAIGGLSVKVADIA